MGPIYFVRQYAKTRGDVSTETAMHGEKIFRDNYLPPLEKMGITEMTIRDYAHTSGTVADDPSGTLMFRHVPLRDVDETITQLFQKHGGDNRGIAITSCVRTENGPKRLLLLDFALAVTLKNEQAIYHALRECAAESEAYKNSALMRTTSSYHLVGFTPLRYNAWVRAMGTALLLGGHELPMIDTRYIGHSLMRGYGSLRVSDMGTKETPTLISYLM